MVDKQYRFTSKRLGFRNWMEEDVPVMADFCADEEVMRYFPSTLTLEETSLQLQRMRQMYEDRGYCYFAVDKLEDAQLLGFIGICYQDYDAPFTPCVDIGWRLGKQHWGRGYATEGALRCLDFAFHELQLNELYSVASAGNEPSINVMRKIGMKRLGQFKHPKLGDFPDLVDCDFYHIGKQAGIPGENYTRNE